MNAPIAILWPAAACAALPLTPQRSDAQDVDFLATKLFDATGQRVFLFQLLPASVYPISGPPVEAIPALGPA
jgi:hypothetical protein